VSSWTPNPSRLPSHTRHRRTSCACSGRPPFSSAPAEARRAETYPVATSATITVSGHGYGHGHGLSQWGAQGAGLQGLGYRQIVEFYYPGTTWGTAAGKVSVLIGADTTKDVVVEAVPGLTVKSLSKKKVYRVAALRPGATTWKLKPRGATTQVMFRSAGGWRKLTAFAGDAEFAAGSSPLTLKVPGSTPTYRGKLRATRNDTVNIVPLEAYLKGVVPREVPAQWTPAAVQAQAVAARTYAAFERGNASAGRHFQVYDTTRSQVYGGVDAEEPESDAAVGATAGEVLTYGGAPAFTQFSASNGGWTSAGSQPYLVAKQDPYDAAGGANPHASWRSVLSDKTIEGKWPAVGDLTRIDIPVRDGNGDLGGRADDVVLTGTAGTVTVSGEDFRFVLGLRSDWFALQVG
jgi:stage II sporulation protein D